MKIDIFTKEEIEQKIKAKVKNLEELDNNLKYWKDRIRTLETQHKKIIREILEIREELFKTMDKNKILEDLINESIKNNNKICERLKLNEKNG